MPQHLGQVIKGFKIATNRVYKQVCSAAILSQPTVPNRKLGMLWSIGYNDGILDRRGQLDNWFNYLRDNPRRLLMKRSRPEFFRVQRNIKVGEFEFSAIGNRFLLSHPVRLQVQCSRSLSEVQIEMRKRFFWKRLVAAQSLCHQAFRRVKRPLCVQRLMPASRSFCCKRMVLPG